MQLDILPTLEPGLYPSQSEHQKEIEAYFGPSLFRELSPSETASLRDLDIFFVLFTNRCGSTLLTEIMHQVCFGIPPRVEVFNSDLLIASSKQYDVQSFTQYFLQAVLGWQENQQVGFKIGAQQLFWLTKTGLLSHFRNVRIINSKRRDTVSQAVSFYIAKQTGQWHSLMRKNSDIGKIRYSRNEILRCLHAIHDGQRLFTYYADMHSLPSLDVDYEDVLENPDREINRIAVFLDAPELAEVPVDLAAIDIKQQRNEDNVRLLALFKQDFFWQIDGENKWGQSKVPE